MQELLVENSLNVDGLITGGFVEGVGIDIKWQEGPIVDGEQNGALVDEVLKAALQRLEAYNATDLRCRENSLAITKIEEALMWLDARQKDRTQRGVQGTYQA